MLKQMNFLIFKLLIFLLGIIVGFERSNLIFTFLFEDILASNFKIFFIVTDFPLDMLIGLIFFFNKKTNQNYGQCYRWAKNKNAF